jgi:hypothetical protein
VVFAVVLVEVVIWLLAFGIALLLYLSVVRRLAKRINSVVIRIVAAAAYGALTALGVAAGSGHGGGIPVPAVLAIIGGGGGSARFNWISLVASAALMVIIEHGISSRAMRTPEVNGS